MPPWAEQLPWPVIEEKSKLFQLDPLLIGCLIQQESGGNPFALRFEPQYRYAWECRTFAEKIGSSIETETQGQMSSWGVMQVMGGVARELGFQGWFPELSQLDVGLEYGCRQFKRKLQSYSNLWDAVSAYNQGSPRKTAGGQYENFRYVDQVHQYYRALQVLPI